MIIASTFRQLNTVVLLEVNRIRRCIQLTYSVFVLFSLIVVTEDRSIIRNLVHLSNQLSQARDSALVTIDSGRIITISMFFAFSLDLERSHTILYSHRRIFHDSDVFVCRIWMPVVECILVDHQLFFRQILVTKIFIAIVLLIYRYKFQRISSEV